MSPRPSPSARTPANNADLFMRVSNPFRCGDVSHGPFPPYDVPPAWAIHGHRSLAPGLRSSGQTGFAPGTSTSTGQGRGIMIRSLALALIAVLLVGLPAFAADDTGRHSGRVVDIKNGGKGLVLEEMGPWLGPN